MPALSALFREVFHLSDYGAIELVTAEAVRVRDGVVVAALMTGHVAPLLKVMKTERIRIKQPKIKAVRRKGRGR